MTVLTESLSNLRRCRYTNINLVHKPMLRSKLTPELKDAVRGRNERTAAGCLRELQAVLSCWNKHEFESKPCDAEIKSFQKCFAEMEVAEMKRKELESKGLIANEDTKLSRKQVNTLLRLRPQLRPYDPFKVHDSFKF